MPLCVFHLSAFLNFLRLRRQLNVCDQEETRPVATISLLYWQQKFRQAWTPSSLTLAMCAAWIFIHPARLLVIKATGPRAINHEFGRSINSCRRRPVMFAFLLGLSFCGGKLVRLRPVPGYECICLQHFQWLRLRRRLRFIKLKRSLARLRGVWLVLYRKALLTAFTRVWKPNVPFALMLIPFRQSPSYQGSMESGAAPPSVVNNEACTIYAARLGRNPIRLLQDDTVSGNNQEVSVKAQPVALYLHLVWNFSGWKTAMLFGQCKLLYRALY